MIIGLVGKPSSGKSSFFKAATLIDVKITGIPFTTIKPNIGVGYVIIDCVDQELHTKCNPNQGFCKNGKRYIPVRLVDVAGLVPGAHEGRGLGNQFLDDLRQASVLIHTVDASGLTDEEGKPTEGHDPNFDIEFLEKELDLWFTDVIKKALVKFQRQIARSSKADLVKILTEQLAGLEVSRSQIERTLETASVTDIEKFTKLIRHSSKPILIAANKIDLKPAQENFEKLKQKHNNIIPTSAESEIALRKATEKGLIDYIPGGNFQIKGSLEERQKKALEIIRKEVIEKYGSTGVQDCLNKSIFELLNYIAVYPVADANKLTDKKGKVLPDIFLVPKGTTAKDLAFRIHTDLGEKFICGIDARTKRRLAADYPLKNNDVVEIMTSK